MAGIARASYKRSLLKEALQFANDAIAASPDAAANYDTRAHIHQALGQVDEAFADYERAISLDTEGSLLLGYQYGLNNAGLYSGEIDGLYGPGTRAALLACTQRIDCEPLSEDEKIGSSWLNLIQ